MLEAIHKSEPQTIRFCFLTNNDKTKYLHVIKDTIDQGFREMINKMTVIEDKWHSRNNLESNQEQNNKLKLMEKEK